MIEPLWLQILIWIIPTTTKEIVLWVLAVLLLIWIISKLKKKKSKGAN